MTDTTQRRFNLSPASWVSIIIGLLMFVVGFSLTLNADAIKERLAAVESKNEMQDDAAKETLRLVNSNIVSVNVIISKLDDLSKNMQDVKDTVKQIQRAQ